MNIILHINYVNAHIYGRPYNNFKHRNIYVLSYLQDFRQIDEREEHPIIRTLLASTKFILQLVLGCVVNFAILLGLIGNCTVTPL